MFSMWGPDQPASALLPGKVPRAPNHVSTHWRGGGGILNLHEFYFLSISCAVILFRGLLLCVRISFSIILLCMNCWGIPPLPHDQFSKGGVDEDKLVSPFGQQLLK